MITSFQFEIVTCDKRSRGEVTDKLTSHLPRHMSVYTLDKDNHESCDSDWLYGTLISAPASQRWEETDWISLVMNEWASKWGRLKMRWRCPKRKNLNDKKKCAKTASCEVTLTPGTTSHNMKTDPETDVTLLILPTFIESLPRTITAPPGRVPINMHHWYKSTSFYSNSLEKQITFSFLQYTVQRPQTHQVILTVYMWWPVSGRRRPPASLWSRPYSPVTDFSLTITAFSSLHTLCCGEQHNRRPASFHVTISHILVMLALLQH